MVDGIQERLRNRERATGEIQDHLVDTPAHGALAVPIHVCLWNVLDQRDAELDVAKEVHIVQPRDDGVTCKKQQHIDGYPSASGHHHAHNRVDIVGSALHHHASNQPAIQYIVRSIYDIRYR
jgi:hypothetical protein